MNTIKYDLSTEDDTFTNMKLLPIFKQMFSIDSHQAKCKKCDFACKPHGNDMFFHLMICGGSLISDNIKIRCTFNCLVCSFKTKRLHEWKTHLFEPVHISENSCMTKYSYDCDSCNTHFYGFEDMILKHQCKPKSLSILSKLMAYAFKSFKIQHKQMLYFCSDCEYYSYNVTDLHVRKCKDLINSATFVCKSCLITFYGTNEKTFVNHQYSFEHMILWCLNGQRNNTEQNKSSPFPRLPSFITKYFEICCLLRQCQCIVCYKILFTSYSSIYDHFIKCIASKQISEYSYSIPLESAHCEVCMYNEYSTQEKNLYKNWVKHVTSLKHLNMILKNKIKLYSYYCSNIENIFYCTEYFLQSQMVIPNDLDKYSLFVPKLMAEVFEKHSNSDHHSYLDHPELFICGFCKNSKNNQSKKYCEHENMNSNQLFFCLTCLVKFSVQTDYTEHLLSSEHIILNYFKPNQTSELRYLDHSMKKGCSRKLTQSDDDNNERFSLLDINGNDEEICVPFNNNNIESQNVLRESYSLHGTTKENTEVESKRNRQNDNLPNKSFSTSCVTQEDSVLNCIRKLSASSPKSALNNYLRMKVELLNQMPHAINVFSESISFFCTICNSVFCDQYDWSKHFTERHSKINNPLVFFCAICHIYHISTYISINDHIQTIEHSVMLEFQNNMKNNAINPIVHDHMNYTPADSIQVSKEKNGDNADQNSKEIQKNYNIYIEIKDVIDANLISDNYFSLSNIIKKKYGNFTQIANKRKSFIVCFEQTNQVENFINDEKELTKQYGFKLQVLGQNSELPLKTIELFSDWKTYNIIISNHLKLMKPIGKTKVKELCAAVCGFNIGTDSIQVHVFGSRLYELATEKSDVDLYLDIGGTFNGDIANDIYRQVDLVKTFAQQCYLKCDEFKNIKEIIEARVPIIKFYHVPTNFNCDISFKSGLSVYKSKLIKLYLSSHIDVKWFVCAVKCWALDNNLINPNLFTSYAFVWLVLFYLMARKIIPSIVELVENAIRDDQKIIEGWDCTFGKLPRAVNNQNRLKLLLGFFEYYGNKRQLKYHVLSTLTGKIIARNNFFQNICKLPELSEIQREKFKTFESKVNASFVNHHGLAIHDPFELSFNITRNITSGKLIDFCELCDQSKTQLSNIGGFEIEGFK